MPRRLAISRLLSPSLRAASFPARACLLSWAAHAASHPFLLGRFRLHAVPQNISLELRKHCQHPGVFNDNYS